MVFRILRSSLAAHATDTPPRSSRGAPRGRGSLSIATLLVLNAARLSAQTNTGGAMTAPTDSAGLAEIVVTAERREQRLQDVPAAVTAIGGAELASRVVLSIPDALSSVPDLQISKAYGEGGAPNFVIRGISSTDFAMASSKPVALYFDEGVRTMSVFENMPIFDIDRIEVLRGPQGTLYGRNATAGAVNILSKTPGFDTEGYITAGYGNFNESTLQGAFQTAIIDNVLSARVAFTYNRNKGVIKQLTPGLGNLDQTDVFAVRGTLFFQPSPEFDATLRLVHYTTGGRDAASYPGPVGPHFNLDGYPGLQAVPGALRQGAGFFDSATDVAPSRSIGVDGINLLVHWHISDAYTLTSVTTYDVGRWRSDQDVDGLPLSMDAAAHRVILDLATAATALPRTTALHSDVPMIQVM